MDIDALLLFKDGYEKNIHLSFKLLLQLPMHTGGDVLDC